MIYLGGQHLHHILILEKLHRLIKMICNKSLLFCFIEQLSLKKIYKTSLLRRLQTQTLPNEAPSIGKTHPFSKIAVTFEPVMPFGCPSGLESPEKW